jgi:hypothetical protein
VELLENRTLLTSIGVDVKGSSTWAGDPTWVNVRNLFVPWGQYSSPSIPNPSLKLTADGYPLAPAATYAFINNYPDGQYQVSYQGTAILSFGGIGQLTTPATLGSDGLYHGVVTVNHALNPNNPSLILGVSGLNASNPFDNLQIIMPGYGTKPTQIFTNSLLQDLQPFSDIRMVEWNNTINSTQVNWQDRVTQNYFTSSGPKGTSYEDIIALANESNKDLWITVPALATSAYVQSLAQLIDQDLNPNLKVYVEYSNETWNTAFHEYGQVLAAADSNPLVTYKSNAEYAVAQQTAFQIHNIGAIFKQVFGSQSSRVIPVFAGWAAASNYNQVGLQFLRTNYGAVSNSIADFAIAPYVILTPGTDAKGMTMTALFNSMENYLNTQVSSWLTANESLSKTYGVPVISYEAGQGLYPNNSQNPTLQIQAQTDPGMYTLYKNLIAMWEKDIGTLLNFYALNGSYWGLLPSVDAAGSEKWDAVISSILPAGTASLDSHVTTTDINMIEAHMGDPNAWWKDGDFNHDGVVNSQDLAMAEANLPATPAAAKFVSQDTNTQGNWQAVYGSDGYNIIGNQASYPDYASVTTSNASTYIWNSSTGDTRALQDANTTGLTNRTAACWYSTTGSFTVHVVLPDGNTHVVSIYADDWDSQGRSERVDVVDPSTGTVLDSRTISSFSQGVYLSWQLTRNIDLRFTALAGPNAVLDGIFFDHVDSKAFLGADTTTQGNWNGVYGTDGYDIIGDLSSIPTYAQLTTTNAFNYLWTGSTTDIRALVKADPGATDRIAASLYNQSGQFSINIDLTDGLSHVVTLYALDWDQAGRSERVDLIDQSTGNVLDSRTISAFSGGTYLSWNIRGNVSFRVTRTSQNCVISGIFFGGINSARFSSTNTTTQGNWEGVYGHNGYDIVGDQSSIPSYAQLTTSNATTVVWSNSTSAVQALKKATPGATSNIAACWHNSTGPFSININFTDGQTHGLSIYALDWDQAGRSERVDVIDPFTGIVLDSRTISSFNGGVYLSWAIKGQVELLVTPLTGPDAVISGVFFDSFNSAKYAGTNVYTHGNWIGAFGKAGYDVIGKQTSLPSYAVLSATNASTFVWARSTTDPRALQYSGGSGRIAGCWYNTSSFTVNINLTDGQTHTVSIYALDWDYYARSERVDVIDPSTGAVLDSRTISSLRDGVYLTWKIRGSVQLRFTTLAGPNAVVSGIFFDS